MLHCSGEFHNMEYMKIFWNKPQLTQNVSSLSALLCYNRLMIENGYVENIKVKYSEMDYNQALKPFSMLNYLQDIASKNAEDSGFGYSFITPKNIAWFLLKYHMEFSDYPAGVRDLTLKTQPRGYNKLFAYRDFEFFDGTSLLGRVASIWALVDITTRALIPINNVLCDNPKMPPYQKQPDDLNFEKIRPLAKIDYEKEFEVRYNDLDVNKHANNGNYIIWAFEPLDFDFKSAHKIKTLDMVYKKEIKFGEKLISQVELKEDNTTLHLLKHAGDGEELCLIQCKWT